MAWFVAFIGFLVFVAGIVSLIKPLAFLRIATRKTAGLVALAGLVVFVVGGTVGSAIDEEEQEPTAQVDVTTTTTEATTTTIQATATTEEATTTTQATTTTLGIPGTLGMTPEEFRVAWNEAADEFDFSELRISAVSVEEGEVQDVFQHEFSPRLFLQGSVNKADGSLREVLIIGSSPEMADNLTMLASWGILIAATNPDLPPEQRGEILNELGLGQEGVDFSDHQATTVRNNVEYMLQSSDVLGFFFIASDARDG